MRLRTPCSSLSILGLGLSTMEPSGEPTVEAALNVPFTLAPFQTASLAEERLSVTFLGVLADTR